jgi:hypothetical protein
MARYVRDNPELFGEDLVALGWTAVGLTVSGWANDKVVAPVARRFITTLPTPDNTVGKLVDAATTAVAALLSGTVVGMVDRRIGRHFLRGGLMLGVAKVISAFVPGFSLSGSIPLPSIQLPFLGAPSAPAVPSGSTGAAGSSGSVSLSSPGPMSSAVGGL